MTKLAKAQEKIMNIKLSSTRLDLFPKLDKAQEKRLEKECRKYINCDSCKLKPCSQCQENIDKLKQHLADELAREREKMERKVRRLAKKHSWHSWSDNLMEEDLSKLSKNK